MGWAHTAQSGKRDCNILVIVIVLAVGAAAGQQPHTAVAGGAVGGVCGAAHAELA
jgi:hypothetical protein